MKRQIRLGLVCLVYETFDVQATADRYGRIRERVSGLESVVWEIVPNAVGTMDEARSAAVRLAEANLDAIICVSGAFRPSDLVSEIRNRNDLPLLLWRPEASPEEEERKRLRSL